MENQSNSGGLSLFTLLFVAFLVCKLGEITAIQHWSWWWIFAPLWIPALLVIAAYLFEIIKILFKK